MIFPVNFALDGDLVVFRTDPGTKLTYGGFGPVAFEADAFDATKKEGWSVVVAGTGREITDALDEASEREREMPLQPWASGPKGSWIRILWAEITGRRLHQSLLDVAQPDSTDGVEQASGLPARSVATEPRLSEIRGEIAPRCR